MDGEDGLDGFANVWSGNIEVPSQPLGITIEFEEGDELTGNISIPVQGIENHPLSLVNLDGDGSIYFNAEIQGQTIAFNGKVTGREMSGKFTQNGASFPFELSKGKRDGNNETEKGDFLEVETKHGRMYGELLAPEGEGPFPVMLIIPGSGPTDRNGNAPGMENNGLKMLAEELASNGIASVRYDKRGAGKNKVEHISEEEITFDVFVEDAVDWIELLKGDERFSGVGVIGHSQGSLEGMLAAKESDIDMFVSVSGPGRAADLILEEQLGNQLSGDLLAESRKILRQMASGQQVDEMSEAMRQFFRPSVQPFMISWMAYDPQEEISELEIPVLIVNGDNDIQIPESEAQLLQEACPEAELRIIKGMNHVLKEAGGDRDSNIATYADPSLPLAEGFSEAVVSFIRQHQP